MAMGRATLSGSLIFGTVVAPIKVIKGTDEIGSDVKLNMIHEGCGGGINMPKKCAKCDATGLVEADLGRAINGVRVDPDVLESFKVKSDQSIEVQTVVPLADIDKRLYSDPRFLAPGKGGETALRAVRDGLLRLGDAKGEPFAGIGKVAKTEREVVVAIYVKDGAVVMHDLRWPEELRDTKDYAGAVDAGKVLSDKLLKGVDTLVESMLGRFDPANYVDEKGNLRATVLRQIAAGAPLPEAQTFEAAEPKDSLEAQIEAAVLAAKARRAA